MKYEKMIDSVLVQSDTEIDDNLALSAIKDIKSKTTESGQPITVLKIATPIYPNERIDKMNQGLYGESTQTVGDLISALQKLPKDMPYKENWSTLQVYQGLSYNDDNTATIQTRLLATE